MADYEYEDARNKSNGMQTNPYAGYNYQGGYPSYQNYNSPQSYGYPGGYVQGAAQQPGAMQGAAPQPGLMQGAQGPFLGGAMSPGGIPLTEQTSFVENILRLNRGKVATVYMSFENNSEWSSKIFKGTIEAAGKDFLILKDVNSEKRFLLLMIYLDYVTFDEEINFFYPSELYSVGNA